MFIHLRRRVDGTENFREAWLWAFPGGPAENDVVDGVAEGASWPNVKDAGALALAGAPPKLNVNGAAGVDAGWPN